MRAALIIRLLRPSSDSLLSRSSSDSVISLTEGEGEGAAEATFGVKRDEYERARSAIKG